METENLTKEEFISLPALSYSGMKLLEKSPYHYKNREYKDPTPALIFGRHFHRFTLEPEKFNSSVAVYSHPYKRGGVWTEFLERHSGKEVISQDDFHKLNMMRYSIVSSRTASALLKDRFPKEQRLVWVDKKHGVMCKGIIDIDLPYFDTLAEIKTCLNASKDQITKDIYNYKYHWQALWYLNGKNTSQKEVFYRNFIWVFVEKNYPYAVAIYRADQHMLDTARKEVEPLVKTYKQCLETNHWYSYPDYIQDISLPHWVN